jgi:type IV secretion system protein TrbI
MRYWSSLPALFFGLRFLGNGMNRPPTIEIRPGYQFNVMVTQDLVFLGPYAK